MTGRFDVSGLPDFDLDSWKVNRLFVMALAKRLGVTAQELFAWAGVPSGGRGMFYPCHAWRKMSVIKSRPFLDLEKRINSEGRVALKKEVKRASKAHKRDKLADLMEGI